MPATKVAVAPLFMKDCLFRVGPEASGFDFEAHLSGVVFTPATSMQSWKGLTPESVHTDGSAPTWTADLSYVQDWETANSLSNYLFAHQGETVPVKFEPKKGGKPIYAKIVIQPGAIGGQVDSFAATTVSLGVSGAPSFTAPAA